MNPRPRLDHRCPRCKEVGDPRMCNCMRRLRRYANEARERLRRGHWKHAGASLANIENLLEQLALDAQVTKREERQPRSRGGAERESTQMSVDDVIAEIERKAA